jgi:hypothetical protein
MVGPAMPPPLVVPLLALDGQPHASQLWYKKPPTGSDPYHQNHLLDFDGAWNS